MVWPLAAMLALVGCHEVDGKPPQDSEEEVAPTQAQCLLDTVVVLEDHAMTPEGYGRSPDQLLSEVSGVFSGSVEIAGLTAEGRLHIDDRVGEVRMVTSSWSDTGEPCGSWYELEVSARLFAGFGLLDEVFSAVIDYEPGHEARFELHIPLDQVRGSLRPEALQLEAASLGVVARYTPVGAAALDPVWTGELAWLVDDEDGPWEAPAGAFWFW